MDQPASRLSDEQLDRIMGNLLRAGVLLAAAVVVLGGTLYLHRYGRQRSHTHVFQGEPAALRHIPGIMEEAAHLHSRGVIQFGLLLLVATPVARVVFALIAFALQRDRTYVVVALIVLAVLLYGLAGGQV
jgi:uncharacterized membrane protein